MKRNRPKQHTRKLKSGKRVIINKGVTRKRNKYSYATGVINNKRDENVQLSKEIDKLKERIDNANIGEKNYLETSISNKKKRMVGNSIDIDIINSYNFKNNPR